MADEAVEEYFDRSPSRFRAVYRNVADEELFNHRARQVQSDSDEEQDIIYNSASGGPTERSTGRNVFRKLNTFYRNFDEGGDLSTLQGTVFKVEIGTSPTIAADGGSMSQKRGSGVRKPIVQSSKNRIEISWEADQAKMSSHLHEMANVGEKREEATSVSLQNYALVDVDQKSASRRLTLQVNTGIQPAYGGQEEKAQFISHQKQYVHPYQRESVPNFLTEELKASSPTALRVLLSSLQEKTQHNIPLTKNSPGTPTLCSGAEITTMLRTAESDTALFMASMDVSEQTHKLGFSGLFSDESNSVLSSIHTPDIHLPKYYDFSKSGNELPPTPKANLHSDGKINFRDKMVMRKIRKEVILAYAASDFDCTGLLGRLEFGKFIELMKMCPPEQSSAARKVARELKDKGYRVAAKLSELVDQEAVNSHDDDEHHIGTILAGGVTQLGALYFVELASGCTQHVESSHIWDKIDRQTKREIKDIRTTLKYLAVPQKHVKNKDIREEVQKSWSQKDYAVVPGVNYLNEDDGATFDFNMSIDEQKECTEEKAKVRVDKERVNRRAETRWNRAVDTEREKFNAVHTFKPAFCKPPPAEIGDHVAFTCIDKNHKNYGSAMYGYVDAVVMEDQLDILLDGEDEGKMRVPTATTRIIRRKNMGLSVSRDGKGIIKGVDSQNTTFRKQDTRTTEDKEYESHCTFTPHIMTAPWELNFGLEDFPEELFYAKQAGMGANYLSEQSFVVGPPKGAGGFLFYYNEKFPPDFKEHSYIEYATPPMAPALERQLMLGESGGTSENEKKPCMKKHAPSPMTEGPPGSIPVAPTLPLYAWLQGSDPLATGDGKPKALTAPKSGGTKKPGNGSSKSPMEMVLAEMAKKFKGGKKIELKEVEKKIDDKGSGPRRLKGKHTGPKKRRGAATFGDVIDELSYTLAKMRGEVVSEGEDEKEEEEKEAEEKEDEEKEEEEVQKPILPSKKIGGLPLPPASLTKLFAPVAKDESKPESTKKDAITPAVTGPSAKDIFDALPPENKDKVAVDAPDRSNVPAPPPLPHCWPPVTYTGSSEADPASIPPIVSITEPVFVDVEAKGDDKKQANDKQEGGFCFKSEREVKGNDLTIIFPGMIGMCKSKKVLPSGYYMKAPPDQAASIFPSSILKMGIVKRGFVMKMIKKWREFKEGLARKKQITENGDTCRTAPDDYFRGIEKLTKAREHREKLIQQQKSLEMRNYTEKSEKYTSMVTVPHEFRFQTEERMNHKFRFNGPRQELRPENNVLSHTGKSKGYLHSTMENNMGKANAAFAYSLRNHKPIATVDLTSFRTAQGVDRSQAPGSADVRAKNKMKRTERREREKQKQDRLHEAERRRKESLHKRAAESYTPAKFSHPHQKLLLKYESQVPGLTSSAIRAHAEYTSTHSETAIAPTQLFRYDD